MATYVITVQSEDGTEHELTSFYAWGKNSAKRRYAEVQKKEAALTHLILYQLRSRGRQRTFITCTCLD